MLDNLVESKNHFREQKKIGGLMLSTSVVVVMLLTSAIVYSLFSHTLVLGPENLEISALIAPVQFDPKPEPVNEPKIQKSENNVSNETKIPTRRAVIQRPQESPIAVPKNISVTPSDLQTRPDTKYLISTKDSNPESDGLPGRRTPATELPSGNGGGLTPPGPADAPKEIPPPVRVPVKERVPPIVTGGVVNGKALRLVTPVYSATAKGLGLKGEVRVQVMIDENGNVISASAVSGHALLRSDAVSAARASKFSPTTLSNQRVKVTGFIVYNFS